MSLEPQRIEFEYLGMSGYMFQNNKKWFIKISLPMFHWSLHNRKCEYCVQDFDQYALDYGFEAALNLPWSCECVSLKFVDCPVEINYLKAFNGLITTPYLERYGIIGWSSSFTNLIKITDEIKTMCSYLNSLESRMTRIDKPFGAIGANGANDPSDLIKETVDIPECTLM